MSKWLRRKFSLVKLCLPCEKSNSSTKKFAKLCNFHLSHKQSFNMCLGGGFWTQFLPRGEWWFGQTILQKFKCSGPYPWGGRLRVPLKLWVDHATLHRERLSLSILRVNIFYYINGSVLQGFPFLGRAVTACNNFFMCLISPISAFCATLWGLRNEWQSVLRSGSNIVCQIFLSVKAFRVYMIN